MEEPTAQQPPEAPLAAPTTTLGFYDALIEMIAQEADQTETAAISSVKIRRRGGRRAVPAARIKEKKVRAVTFCKRKNGLLKKAYQVARMTNCNVFVLVQQVPRDRPVNNYGFACGAWRTAYGSEVVKRILSLATSAAPTPAAAEPQQHHQHHQQVVLDSIYAPVEPYNVGIEDSAARLCPIQDRRSASRDDYCTIRIGDLKRECVTEFQPESFVDECALDEELDRALGEIDSQEPTVAATEDAPMPDVPAQEPSRRRGPVALRYIGDNKSRSTSFCKRKGGVLRKAFELSAMTGCNCLVVLSCSTQPGRVPNMYHVYASPLWRSAPECGELISLLRLGQKAANHVESLNAGPDCLLESPAERYVNALGDKEDVQLQLEFMTEGYFMPTSALKVDYHDLYNDKAFSFKWCVEKRKAEQSQGSETSDQADGDLRTHKPKKQRKAVRNSREDYGRPESNNDLPMLLLTTTTMTTTTTTASAVVTHQRMPTIVTMPQHDTVQESTDEDEYLFHAFAAMAEATQRAKEPAVVEPPRAAPTPTPPKTRSPMVITAAKDPIETPAPVKSAPAKRKETPEESAPTKKQQALTKPLKADTKVVKKSQVTKPTPSVSIASKSVREVASGAMFM